MTTVHLIHGFVGVGKTTVAKQMELDLSAIRFTPDDWMTRLYGSNPDQKEYSILEERITSLIWELAERLVRQGHDVIMDFGFWTRGDRDSARERISEMGADAKLYLVTCADDLMKARVLKRTDELPEGALYIDEHAIEIFRKRFEPLGDDEPHVVVRTDK